MKMKLFQDPKNDVGCLRVLRSGSKHWEPEMFAQFKHVANISIASYCREIYDVIEEAFSIHNKYDLDEDRIERLGRQHSMSVGDIVLNDGKFFMCENYGWGELEELTSKRAENMKKTEALIYSILSDYEHEKEHYNKGGA